MGKHRGPGGPPHSSGRNSRRRMQDNLAGFRHESDHGQFIGEALSSVPFVRRVPETIHIVQRPRESGIVGPEPDYSVRTSYIPVGLFHTLLRWIGKQRTYQIFSGYSQIQRDLSPAESAKYRPPKGFMSMNLNWTDSQVKAWTKMAHLCGITYVGKQHYNVPKALLGYWRGGTHYHNPMPREWHKLGPYADLTLPLKKRHPRSEKRRIGRSLERSVKEVIVKPLPLQSVLGLRKIYTKREIDRMYQRDMPISQFRESIPTCLSIRFGKPRQVPQIVLESLRRIYSTPQKFLHDLSWLVPKGKEPVVKLTMKAAPTREAVKKKVRLIAHLERTEKGGLFRAMATTSSRLELPLTGYLSTLTAESERYKEIRKKQSEWQKILDDDSSDEYHAGDVLGDW